MSRRTSHPLFRRGPAGRAGATAVAAVVAAAALTCNPAAGQDVRPATDQPSTRPTYPALEQLNLECVALYERLQAGVARVQVPHARIRVADNAMDGPWNRYKVNPEVRQELERRVVEQQQLRNNAHPTASQPAGPPGTSQPRRRTTNDAQTAEQPLSQPSQGDAAPNGSAPATAESFAAKQQQQQLAPVQNGVTIVLPPQPYANNVEQWLPAQPQLVLDNNAGQRGAGLGNNARPPLQAAGGFAPNTIGLLLNDRGHVLVPAFLDRDAVGDQPVRLAWGGGDAVVEARLVGADQQTQLSVVKLAAPPPAGPRPAPVRPVTLSGRRLADGTLVLVVNPLDGVGRLTVWNGGAGGAGGGGPRDAGVVVTIDGEVAGVARAGQFLPGGACQLIADQIVRHGSVRRATLGVFISQVEPADPARQQLPELGDKPAVRVDEVVKGSVADRGGLRQGDLILAFGGEPVHDIPSLAVAIAARSGRTELTVLRDGRPTPVAVDLVQR